MRASDPESPRGASGQRHRLLGDPSRLRILELLEGATQPLPAATIAATVGLHSSTARFHLELLVDAGLVHRTTEIRHVRGRPRTLYAAVPGADPDHPYQSLAEVLAERLAGPGGAASAQLGGVAWGQRLQPAPQQPSSAEDARQRLVEVFTLVGFAPTLTEEGNLALTRCPFNDVARRNPGVVCGVHLGLAQGVLQQLGAPLTANRLEPFAGPGTCVLHLRVRPS